MIVPPPPRSTERRNDSLTLRGGRLRKTNRGLLTFAPFLATVSAVALGALLSLTPTDSAHAQMCTSPTTAGLVTCSGSGAVSSTIAIMGPSMANLTVTDAADFGITSTTATNGNPLSITGSSGHEMTVTLDGDITAGTSGAYPHAIRARHSGGGTMSITANGDLTSTATGNGRGIFAYHSGSGDLNITATGTIMATGTGGNGIYTSNMGGGDTVIIVSGSITGGSGAGSFAIDMQYGGGRTLRLLPGAMLTGAIRSGTGSGASGGTLELADAATGTSSGTFALGGLSDFMGFADFDKTGDGTWTLTGAQPTGKEFTSADVMGGTLRLGDGTNAATLLVGTTGTAASLILAANTTLESMGENTITGGLTNNASGNISLAVGSDTGADDSLTVSGAFDGGGGTLTLDVDLTGTTPAADQLILSGTSTGMVTIDLRVTATENMTADPVALVDATSITTPADNAATFMAGDCTISGGNGSCTVTVDTAAMATVTVSGVTATPPPGGNGGNGGGGMPDPDPVTVVENMCAGQSTGSTFICDGTVADATTLAADAGETLTVTATDDFTGITVTSGDALTLTGMTGSTGIDVTLGGTISATAGDGINADHDGNGAVSITAGAITASENGIEVSTSTENSAMPTTMSITANGNITAGSDADEAGIDASHAGSGALTITANADVSGNAGISAEVTGSSTADIIVTIGGEIDGDDDTADNDDTAIAMMGGGNHRLVINSGGSIADGDSVTSDATGDRTATLALNAAAGETSGSFDLGDLDDFTGFTVFEKTGAGTWTLTGTQAMDDAFTSASVMAGTLQLNGATLGLDDMATTAALTIASGATLEVMGSSASTIMGGVNNSGTMQVNADLTLGTTAMPDELTNSGTMNLMSGSSVIGNVSNMANGTMHLAGVSGTDTIDGNLTNAGTVNVAGAASITGTLSGAGAISLAMSGDTGTDDSLSVSVAFTGGSVALDVDLTDPDSPAADQLVLGSATGNGMVTLDLRINSGADIELTEMELDALQLIGGNGASSASFADASSCTTIRAGTCDLVVTNGNLTSLTVMLAASDILYENYAASLAELSRVSGMRARFGNRIWATEEGRGIWARAEASNSELEPNTPSETSAAYEIRDTRLRFGVDAPIRAVPGLILGGNVWLARADTDITAAGEDDGKIETEGYALAATAHWQASTGFYVDGQAQFAAFTSDLSSAGETRVDGNDGRGITLAAEVGYPVPVREFTITPQAQLSWSDVDFDDFTASDNDARISLGDGETVDARIGVSVDRRWSERSGTLGHVWGAIDLRAPLDGETSARVDDDAPLISEREEPALGLGMGVSFLLRDNTSIAAELATTQGDEIEEYKGSLALRFTF